MPANELTVILIVGTLGLLTVGFLFVFFFVNNNKKINQVHFDKDAQLSETRKKHIEENERMMNEIAKDLHDNIGQLASLARASLHYAQDLSTEAKMSKVIADTAKLTEQIMRDAKNISHSLNQDFIKAGNLHVLLEEELSLIKNYHNVDYDLEYIGDTQFLTPESKLVVYRIAQEAFHNIVKHAHAQNVHLTMDYRNKHFKMRIADDGVGLPAEKMFARNGIGLSNMRQRAEYLNGNIIIDSQPAMGCAVTLIIPDCPFLAH
jgi:signal transduction histidine kinase